MVSLYVAETGERPKYRPFSHAEYVTLRAARDVFSDLAVTYRTFASVAEPNGQLRRGAAFFTLENYFQLLGVVPV